MRSEVSMMEDQAISSMLCSLTQRVMIVSPLPERVKSLLVALSAECFDVFSLHDFEEDLLPSLQPELIIYDAIPVRHTLSGNTLQAGEPLLKAAEQRGLPILVLLDQRSYAGRSNANLGSAELLVWPASPNEAVKLINRMLLNRPASMPIVNYGEIRTFKDIQIDLKKMIVNQSNKRVDLTKTEYDLLLYFISSDGSVLTREMLLENVWGLQYFGGSNLVDAHIKSLRKKLGDSAVKSTYIATVRGSGYRLAD